MDPGAAITVFERLARDCPTWSPEVARDLLAAGHVAAALELVVAELDAGHPEARSPAFQELARLIDGAAGATPDVRAAARRLAARLSRLSSAPAVRRGGAGRGERHYRDLIVDGRSLTRAFARDLIPPFGWLPLEAQLATLDGLRGAGAPSRVIVWVCPECADLGCGAISLAVDLGPEVVTWRDFGSENNYQAGWEPLDVGPFRFARDAYLDALGRL